MREKKEQINYLAIMAGGLGSRFWPASREDLPKQFLDITGSGRTLLQQTVDRARKIVALERILIISNRQYKDLILGQLPELGENQLLLEPSRNNTAPCVAYTALHILAKNPDAAFGVLPADHIIGKEKEFTRLMKLAFSTAHAEPSIVTLGIQPTRPDTGYGYIHTDTFGGQLRKVKSFKEKPDKITAQQYLDSQEYLWNAGIFVWSVKTLLHAFETNAPDILSLLSARKEAFGTKDEQSYVNEVYPQTRNISVDFAIIEKANNVLTIPADIHWSDLGTWNSLYDYLSTANNDNVCQAENHLLENVQGTLIRQSNKEKLIVVGGIQDMIIIDDDDVLLIYPREKEQEIKALRQQIKNKRYL